MFENIYKKFFDTYSGMLKVLIKEIDLLDQIILIDFDYYIRFKDMRNCLYICDINLLPTYAKEKIIDSDSVCLKHCGLCLISKVS
tara:strand:- start:135 stop:389 length:255 start_codon:yes stop_codon:yes gene_type:complete